MDPDSENREAVTFFVAAFTLSVAGLAVGLRVYTRKFLVHRLGLDDFCAVVAWLLVFGCDFAVAYNTNYGLGRHAWDIPPAWIPLYLRAFYVSIVLYNAAVMAIKMTFLAQYYRIFQNSSRANQIAFTFVTVFVICWAISQLLIAIFTCHPIQGFWDSTINAVCVPDHPFWEINAAGNIVTDVMILVAPIPTLARLNLPLRQRYILVGIFSLGLFTVCISCIRIRYLKQYEDFTWENVESSGWSMGELACGLTCACLPTLRPLLARYIPWLSSTPSGYCRQHEPNSKVKDLERGQSHSTSSGLPPTDSHGSGRTGSDPFNDGFGLEVFESRGDSSDGVVGLETARESQHRAKAGYNYWRTGEAQQQRRWAQPAVHTEIVAPMPGRAHPTSGPGIQVKRDVVLAKELIG